MISLSKPKRLFLILAVLMVAGGMIIGFWSSFDTLYQAALAHGWQHPALLPLGVDTGILAYVVLDHLAVSLGARSRWLHFVAWGLAAFTVWANAAVVSSAGGSTWRIIHAAMPALWVLGVEALRFIWRQLRKDKTTVPVRDRVPLARWLANPFTAACLQRRMWLINETSWARMALIEDARLYARDLTRAARQVGDVDPPPMLLARISSGRMPGPVLAAISDDLAAGTSLAEAQVHAWVWSQITLPDRVAADLQTERVAIAQTVPAPPPEPPSEPAQDPRAEAARNPARKPSRRPARKAAPEDRLATVRALLADDPETGVGAVMRACQVGRPAARDLLAEAKRPALVTAAR